MTGRMARSYGTVVRYAPPPAPHFPRFRLLMAGRGVNVSYSPAAYYYRAASMAEELTQVNSGQVRGVASNRSLASHCRQCHSTQASSPHPCWSRGAEKHNASSSGSRWQAWLHRHSPAGF